MNQRKVSFSPADSTSSVTNSNRKTSRSVSVPQLTGVSSKNKYGRRYTLLHAWKEEAEAESSVSCTERTLQNTYRIEPKDRIAVSYAFRVTVKNIAQRIVQDTVDSLNPVTSGRKKDQRPAADHATRATAARIIADAVKDQVKNLPGLERYKIVCYALLVETAGQDLRVASLSLCDEDRDHWADTCYTTPHLTGVVSVYGIYFD